MPSAAIPHALPVDPKRFAQLEIAAHQGAFGHNSLPEPSRAQIEAGNYKKGRFRLFGLPIAIEQPRGTYRTGTGADGKPWATRLAGHYGYLPGTQGADGDAVDLFIGPFIAHPTAYLINQFVNGQFDEHKVLLGCADEQHARRLYLDSYERGWPGLESLVPLSISQLKWWLKHGDMLRPLRPQQLPPEGIETMNQPVYWDHNALPATQSLDQLIYDIRRSDSGEGLLLDSVSEQDILGDSDGVLLLDALVTPFVRLERTMEQLRSVMARASDQVKPIAMQITDPFKQRGVANVAAIFELADGQTVSVFFHNPDVTPNKMAPNDELISWKWLLNKKDITIVVAPERGEDLNIREVARRIMRLAEKNSAAFQRRNSQRAERMQNIQSLNDEITTLETELSAAQHELEVAKVVAEEAAAKKQTEPTTGSAVVATYETGRINSKTNRWNKDGLLIVSATDTAGIYVWRYESGLLRTITNTVEVAYQWLAEVLAGLGDALTGQTLSPEKIRTKVRLKSGENLLGSMTLLKEELSDRNFVPEPVPQRKKDNTAAMALLRQIDVGEVDQKALSEEQKTILAKYSGTGGALIGADGKKGSAYEYYTPKPIAEGIWSLLAEQGFQGGKVLDPCAGVGVFGATAPLHAAMDAVELNETSGRINGLVNDGPGYVTTVSPFERVAANTPDEEYDAVVSNVPFGGVADRGGNQLLDNRYQKEPLQNYFILRSLEKLRP
ncbi:hypothetical protein HZU77_016580, partial [Neisseriaceae bacterium TC5R-5]|nr:hypothetical protein [Neisseriaceae bacterium TC5R-5]